MDRCNTRYATMRVRHSPPLHSPPPHHSPSAWNSSINSGQATMTPSRSDRRRLYRSQYVLAITVAARGSPRRQL